MPDLTEEQRKQLEEKIKKMSPEELKEFQKQQCIFCQIIAGKVPSKKVYSDEKCIAVLDINPASKGHLLIIPKEHYAIMPQIPDKEIGHLFLVSKYLSQIMLKVLKVSGTNVFVANGAVAGQRAQHFMLHLIPRKEGDKLLAVEDKIIEANLRAKVKELVENKLNALLGVKKETQKTLAKEAPAAEVKASAETEKETPAEEEPAAKETKKETKEKPKQKKAKSNNQKEVSEKAPSSKKTTKKEAPSGTPKKVSLDDIADLFK